MSLLKIVLFILVFNPCSNSKSLDNRIQNFGNLAVFLNSKSGNPTMTRTEIQSGIVSIQSLDGGKVKFDVEKFTIRYSEGGTITINGNNLKRESSKIRRLKIGSSITIFDVVVKDPKYKSFCMKNSPIVINVR